MLGLDMSALCGWLKVTLFLSSAQSKLEGTVWTDVDDSRVFKVLDLEDIEKTFSAYQRQQVLRTLQLIGRREAGAKR